MKRTYRTSGTPLKEKNTLIMKIEKKEEVQGIGSIFNKNNRRKYPKFWERNIHSGIRIF
jgi:hypothetical protein